MDAFLDFAPRGVIPVLEVPFTDDEAVDEAGFERVTDHLLNAGVDSIMFPGFASEFHKLAHHERRQLSSTLIQQAKDANIPVILSVPEHATRLAVSEACWAIEQGAAAVNVLPPYFMAPNPEAVHAHLVAVLDAVHPVPVIVQYAPAQTGTTMTAATLTRLAAEHPNLAAVKVETALPGRLIEALADNDPPLPALVGYAGLQLADALRRGVDGVQPGCSFTEIYSTIWADWHQGRADEALALHARLLPYLIYWMQEVELIIAVEKVISVRRGLIDSERCRRPSRRLDSHERTMIDAFLNEFADLLTAGSR